MRSGLLGALACAGVLCTTQSAYAATLTVDDDRADCPAAAFTSVQAAVDAATDGDTIVICKGGYVEGSGMPPNGCVIWASTTPMTALETEVPIDRISVLSPLAAAVSDSGTAPMISAGMAA